MSKLHFLVPMYHPGTAFTNRVMAFIRGFSDMGVDVNVTFLFPDENQSTVAVNWSHVNFHYLWSGHTSTNRYLRLLSYGVAVKRFLKRVSKGDVVLSFDVRALMYLVKRHDIYIYTEKTEHPAVYLPFPLTENRYIKLCKKVNGLFVISTSLKDYFIRSGILADRIHIINMIVDSNRFCGLEKQQITPKYLAYCGTASNNKDGVDELIKAFSIVAARYPDLLLYIVGETPSEQDKSGNLRLVSDLGLMDRVVFTGTVSPDAMPQLLKNAEILLLDRPDSLQAKHGFPTKLGEYLLTENPVVVTRVGDIPIFLEDSSSALLAEERNSAQFADKICWLLENPVKAREIGLRGAEVARRCFNYRVETEKILHIIEQETM